MHAIVYLKIYVVLVVDAVEVHPSSREQQGTHFITGECTHLAHSYVLLDLFAQFCLHRIIGYHLLTYSAI